MHTFQSLRRWSSSSALSDRTLNIHLQSSIILQARYQSLHMLLVAMGGTHDVKPSLPRSSTWIGSPESSRGGKMSKVCRIDAMNRKTVASARNFPGHSLKQLRQRTQRTKKVTRANIPATEPKCDRSRVFSIWVEAAILEEPFRDELVRFRKRLGIMQH